MELASVIVPIFNVREYLSVCLESIIEQTYTDIEVIIINDGSTDGSKQIAEEFVQRDHRVRLINQNNSGLSAARNVGVMSAKGEFVFFIDGDDFVSARFIETLVVISKKTQADIVCCESIGFIDSNERSIKRRINNEVITGLQYDVYDARSAQIKMFYQKPSVTGAVLKLYRKKLFEKVVFPDNRYYEDVATTYLFFQSANKVVFLHDKLYAYRFRRNSIMNTDFNPRKMDCLWVAKQIEDNEIIRNDSELWEAAMCSIFRLTRIVYAQVSFNTKEEKELWNALKRYKWKVLRDPNAYLYERGLAALSIVGRYPFRVGLGVFRFIREKTIAGTK